MTTKLEPGVTISYLRDCSALTITRKDAAEALGVDPRTVTAGIGNGTIPAIKLGRRVLIPRAKFLAMFEDTTPAANE